MGAWLWLRPVGAAGLQLLSASGGAQAAPRRLPHQASQAGADELPTVIWDPVHTQQPWILARS